MEKLYIAFVIFMITVGFIIYVKVEELKTSLSLNPINYEKSIETNF